MLDFIAIGLGPFNLSLASLLHNKTDLDYLIFEKKAQFDWHAGMQLPNTVLQVPLWPIWFRWLIRPVRLVF